MNLERTVVILPIQNFRFIVSFQLLNSFIFFCNRAHRLRKWPKHTTQYQMISSHRKSDRDRHIFNRSTHSNKQKKTFFLFVIHSFKCMFPSAHVYLYNYLYFSIKTKKKQQNQCICILALTNSIDYPFQNQFSSLSIENIECLLTIGLKMFAKNSLKRLF